MLIKNFKLGSLSLLLTLSCGRKNVTIVETSNLDPTEQTPPIGVQSLAANPSDCANGGSTLVVFLDENRNNIFEPEESLLSESHVCNGANGSNGANGTNGQNASFSTGSVGPDVVGKNYSACHHDYLFIPNSQNPFRGWLMFRHQGNGSHDQGIGSTGFQVWNVDIPNFSLASEVGGVIYCNLSWDSASRILSYVVVDNSDGLAGLQESIQL